MPSLHRQQQGKQSQSGCADLPLITSQHRIRRGLGAIRDLSERAICATTDPALGWAGQYCGIGISAHKHVRRQRAASFETTQRISVYTPPPALNVVFLDDTFLRRQRGYISMFFSCPLQLLQQEDNGTTTLLNTTNENSHMRRAFE